MKKNNSTWKKIIYIFLIIFTLFAMTGCTKVLKDKDKKAVINTETGQSVTENILCKPTDKNLIELFDKNKISIKTLPNCKNFPISSKYEGLWENVFVRPLAWLILKIGKYVNYYVLSIIIITILIRLIMFPLTQKTASQSENMKKAQPELAKLEKKYKDKQDQESQALKAQEMMMIYKKNHINPVSGCLTSLIQLPVFFAFLEAINRVPAIFEESIFGLKLGTTPWYAITHGNYFVIILNILIVLTTYFSFKMTNATPKDSDNPQDKQMQLMSKFMVVFIGIMSFSLPAAIAIYWIISTTFTILQNIIAKKRGIKNDK